MVNCSSWADVWESCGGKRQSPIDIVSEKVLTAGPEFPLIFTGNCPHFSLSAPHEPLECDVFRGNCEVSLENSVYKLAQFHLHAPSEHTLDGKQKHGEIHFVHKSIDGDALLVVGIFLELDAESDPWLGPLLDTLENVSSAQQTDAVMVRLKPYAKLINTAFANGGAYNYPGSLTTPGCAETVDWWVLKSPMKISSIDYGRLHQDLVEYEITDNGNNARPVQPLLGRSVTYYTS
ncbi:carbonic [Plasmopara halstedii]|uniref:carbonic anhydrase n=1 Tax=Plasmopara halstedii TaxID=4781 RepID=A0A0P1AU47_PLAHL|nr:carbonic [Plasmopara halstedii]CEG44613.1 carbonic [Plasmopara halstedii]|eukprot:XP_024580982.1 carbonic [Plasmopara halstedii]